MAKSLNIKREQASYAWLWISLTCVALVMVLFIGAGVLFFIIAMNLPPVAQQPIIQPAEDDPRAHRLEELRSPVRSIAVTPDGKTVAVGCHDGGIRAWDIVTGNPGPVFQQGHRVIVSGLQYTPDGQTLVSASHDRTVMLWDANTGQVRRTLIGPKVAVWSLAMSGAGNRIATSGPYLDNLPVPGDVTVWDLPLAEKKGVGELPKKIAGASAVALSPDGDSIFIASTDAVVTQWDLAAGKAKIAYAGHHESLWALVLSRDGKLVAAGAQSGEVRIWDTGSAKQLHVLRPGIREPSQCLAFTPDGKVLATLVRDRTIRFWDTTTGQLLTSVKDEDSHPTVIAITPNGKTLAVGRGQYDQMGLPLVGDVKVWDLDRVLPPR